MTEKKIKTKTAFLSLGYWFSATTLGMLLHPYKSMRGVVRYEYSRPLVFVPVVWLYMLCVGSVAVILISRKLGIWLDLVYPRWLYGGLEFLFWWVSWFLGLWQVMAGYLYCRFRRVLG